MSFMRAKSLFYKYNTQITLLLMQEQKSLLYYKHFGANLEQNIERKARHVRGAHTPDPCMTNHFHHRPMLSTFCSINIIHQIQPWYLTSLEGYSYHWCLSHSTSSISISLPAGGRAHCFPRVQGGRAWETAQGLCVSGQDPDNGIVLFFS